ncbi:hypothetical protein CsatB_030669 [Cannabis sativa]
MDIVLVMDGIFGKVGKQCYAVLCLGVLLVSVTIARYVAHDPNKDHHSRTLRRLVALHGHPLRLN